MEELDKSSAAEITDYGNTPGSVAYGDKKAKKVEMMQEQNLIGDLKSFTKKNLILKYFY